MRSKWPQLLIKLPSAKPTPKLGPPTLKPLLNFIPTPKPTLKLALIPKPTPKRILH